MSTYRIHALGGDRSRVRHAHRAVLLDFLAIRPRPDHVIAVLQDEVLRITHGSDRNLQRESEG